MITLGVLLAKAKQEIRLIESNKIILADNGMTLKM